MESVDYGPIDEELKALLEELRMSMPSEKRLLFAMLLARTVVVDGDPFEKKIATSVDLNMTVNFFRARYPPQET